MRFCHLFLHREGVAGSHFGAHGHTIDLFIITVSELKTV